MSVAVHVSGVGGSRLGDHIGAIPQSVAPRVLGAGVAYISTYGATYLKGLADRMSVGDIRVITDIGDAITHPEALRRACEFGWDVRVVQRAHSTFHSKLIVGGDRFLAKGEIEHPNVAILGSANLSRRGLFVNVECAAIVTSGALLPQASAAFAAMWHAGVVLTGSILEQYEKDFAKRSRNRSVRDLKSLGIADDDVDDVAIPSLRKKKAPRKTDRTFSTAVAAAAWVGLESFTGERRFQAEFPRDAGEVLRRIIAAAGGRREFDVLCDDNVVRRASYRYYSDNAMYRLNLPNDTPGIEWVRANKCGIAVVSEPDVDGGPLRVRIVRPGAEANDVIARSVVLGTWGKTSKRLYGWY